MSENARRYYTNGISSRNGELLPDDVVSLTAYRKLRTKIAELEQSIAEDQQYNESMDVVSVENDQLRDRVEELERELGPLKEMQSQVSAEFRSIVNRNPATTADFTDFRAIGSLREILRVWAKATAKQKRGGE